MTGKIVFIKNVQYFIDIVVYYISLCFENIINK